MGKAAYRLAVQKTYKLFIGGKFVHGENGRALSGGRRKANEPIDFAVGLSDLKKVGDMVEKGEVLICAGTHGKFVGDGLPHIERSGGD